MTSPLSVDLAISDFNTWSHYLNKRLNIDLNPFKLMSGKAAFVGSLLCIFIVLMWSGTGKILFGSYYPMLDSILEIMGGCAIILLFAFTLKNFAIAEKYRPDSKGAVIGPRQIILHDDGIEEITEVSTFRLKWTAIKELVDDREHYYLIYDRLRTLIVPKRVFKNEMEQKQFVNEIIAKTSNQPIDISGKLSIEQSTKQWKDYNKTIYIWLGIALLLALPNLFSLWGYEDITGPPEGLRIIDHSLKIDDKIVNIIGTAENASGKTWTTVGLSVDFYDANNRFIDQCQTYIMNVGANQTTPFKATCRISEKINPAITSDVTPETLQQQTRHEIRITNAVRN